MNTARILMLGGLAASLAMPALAQTAPGGQAAPLPPSAGQTRTTDRSSDEVVVPASQLEAGANSYTEGQARSRLEDHGFTAINNLRKDDNGFWRATATRGGTSGEVALDFRGRIAHGEGVANLGPRTIPTGTAADTRANTPAGTTGNPPGTAAGRATDRVVGPNTPDGTPGNPPGTAVGRAVDRAQGQTTPPDGTPGNPPGTAAGRAVDRALGTNNSGANPAPSQR